MLQYFITMECLREQRRIHEGSRILIFSYSFVTQLITTERKFHLPHPHYPSHTLVFSMCWPWLILHPILLSSLPTQYTLATTSGFGLAHMNQSAFIFHVIFHHLRTIGLPAPLQQLDLGEYQGHRVNDCFFLPVKFQGTSNFPWGQLASPQCFSTR